MHTDIGIYEKNNIQQTNEMIKKKKNCEILLEMHETSLK